MVKLFTVSIIVAYLYILNEVIECSIPKEVEKFVRENLNNNNNKEIKPGNSFHTPGNSNNDNFEKFFLKASKSVPRIGRRGFLNDNFYANAGLYGASKYQKAPFVANSLKRTKNFEAPFWSDIAHIYEYNADLPNIMESLSDLELEQGDDPSIYDVNKFDMKRGANNEYPNKETQEFRFQPEVQRFMI